MPAVRQLTSGSEAFRPSAFDILSSFVIGHSSLAIKQTDTVALEY
jgi:hypothetical protein